MDIEYQTRDGVALITLNAPSRRNAITVEMADHLVAALSEADADPAVGAVVIAGQGQAFCAGAHLVALADAEADPAGERSYAEIGRIYKSFLDVTKVGVPTIAAVGGAAVGAGLNLALCADLRVVAHRARLRSAFGQLGLHPGGAHYSLLARTLGREAAAAMGLFGEEIDGDRAVELGLAWRAAEPEAVIELAIELASRVASDPALSRAMIASFRSETAPAVPLELAVQAERAAQMWSFRRRGNA